MESLDWWRAPPKPERKPERRAAALRLYIELGSFAEAALPANCFSGSFYCEDMKRLRPDKAVIKAALESGEIKVRGNVHDELIFEAMPIRPSQGCT